MKRIETQSRQDDGDFFYGALLAIAIGIVLALLLVEWAIS